MAESASRHRCFAPGFSSGRDFRAKRRPGDEQCDPYDIVHEDVPAGGEPLLFLHEVGAEVSEGREGSKSTHEAGEYGEAGRVVGLDDASLEPGQGEAEEQAAQGVGG